MFIKEGARNLLLQGERQKFMAEEWPRIYATIQRLGLKAQELLNGANGQPSGAAPRDTAAKDAAPKSDDREEER